LYVLQAIAVPQANFDPMFGQASSVFTSFQNEVEMRRSYQDAHCTFDYARLYEMLGMRIALISAY